MIEKMKKLALLIYHGSKETFLKDLQNLGAVHLETNSSAQNEEIDRVKSKLHDLLKAHKIVRYAKSNEKKEIKTVAYENDILELAREIDREYEQLDEFNVQLEMLEKEIELLEPWGYFDPENIKKLKDQGINLKFYKIAKAKYTKMEKEFAHEVIAELKGSVYFVVVYQGEFNQQFEEAVEEKLPIKNVKELIRQADDLKKTIENQKEHIFEYKIYQQSLEEAIIALEDELSYYVTGESLQPEAEGKILVITGWIPVKREHELKAFLDSEHVAYIIEEPEKDDDVPVKLKNNAFARLFEPIGGLYSLPDYSELDVVPFFAPFYAFYFGLCLADIGYGILLLVVVAAFMFTVKNKKLKPIFILGIVLGLTTILGGFLLNTFFGTNLINDAAPGNISLLSPEIQKSLKSFVLFNDPTNTAGPMIFALLVGIVQLTLGLVLQTINKVRDHGPLGALQPIGTTLILLGAAILVIVWRANVAYGTGLYHKLMVGPIPLGYMISLIPPSPVLVSIVMAGTGIFFVLLFNNISKKLNPFARLGLGLWEFYGIASGLLGDVLSYIRLFALGLAGGLLGAAFNTIALMVKDSMGGFGIIFTILILIVGHCLNFALAVIGSFVHPLRLTFVEFYKAVDFKGGGKPYNPFSNRSIIKNK